MKKLIVTAFALMFTVTTLMAQNADRKWGIGFWGGKNEYNGELGNGMFEFHKAFYGFGGLSVSRYLNQSFDLTLLGTYGHYGYTVDNTYNTFLSGKKSDASLLLAYKLGTKNFVPSIIAGVGVSNYSGDAHRINTSGGEFNVPVGIGLKYHFSQKVAAQYTGLYTFTDRDHRDNLYGGSNDRFLKHSLGIIISFGGPGDADKDGIKDNIDKCPNTPLNVKVDAEGCPIDADKDGVPDYLDKCPTEAGIAKFNGCPDTDGDGIQDSEDKCPSEAGLTQFGGCPDTDGDGIQDSEDKCPKIAGLASLNGCPDTDGDGIADGDDRCPNEAGTAALKGCPDRDGDGIADIDDKCPDVSGIAANKGCPEVKQETIAVFKQALTGIQFATGKDVIRSVSFPILDKVVTVMKENPSYNLQINGHSDNVGDDAKNLELSQKRANAVKAYIVSKGIAEERMKATGYGETMPVADNNTAAGRTQNRRVEFSVEF